MDIKGLLNNQKIRIDHHQRGSNSPNNWDDPTCDIHIDKYVHDNKDKYKIKIPINSNRPITVNGKNGMNIPKRLLKEINEIFNNDTTRQSFVKRICKVISIYKSDKLNQEQRAKQAIGYIRKAFGLKTPKYIFKDDIKNFYAGLYCHNLQYYYVIIKGKFIFCSLNEGVWKRFNVKENKATYIYDKGIEAIAYEKL